MFTVLIKPKINVKPHAVIKYNDARVRPLRKTIKNNFIYTSLFSIVKE